MNVKNLCLALFGIAGAILISSNPVLASYFLRIQRVDPAPYDKSGNIASYTNISSSSCQLRCQNNGACQAYYFIGSMVIAGSSDVLSTYAKLITY